MKANISFQECVSSDDNIQMCKV